MIGARQRAVAVQEDSFILFIGRNISVKIVGAHRDPTAIGKRARHEQNGPALRAASFHILQRPTATKNRNRLGFEVVPRGALMIREPRIDKAPQKPAGEDCDTRDFQFALHGGTGPKTKPLRQKPQRFEV